MLRFENFDTSRVDRALRDRPRRIRVATAMALTRVAQQAEREIRSDIRRVFDRPTLWAQNSTRIVPARSQGAVTEAQVWLKDRKSQPGGPRSYLWPEVLGGRRERKAYETALLRAGVLRPNEYTVPARGAPLDVNGNMQLGVIRQLLSQLRAAESPGTDRPGFKANRTDSAASLRAVRKAGTFFTPRRTDALPYGIYQRVKTGFGWATRLILAVVVGRPRYKPRLPFFGTVADVRRRYLQQYFDDAIARISVD